MFIFNRNLYLREFNVSSAESVYTRCRLSCRHLQTFWFKRPSSHLISFPLRTRARRSRIRNVKHKNTRHWAFTTGEQNTETAAWKGTGVPLPTERIWWQKIYKSMGMGFNNFFLIKKQKSDQSFTSGCIDNLRGG